MFSIAIEQAIPRFAEYRFQEPVTWKIPEGENGVVIGPNGAGKTILTDMEEIPACVTHYKTLEKPG